MNRLLVVMTLLFNCWAAVAQEPSAPAPPASAAAQATTSAPQAAAKPAAQSAATFWVPAPDERLFLPKGNWIYG